MANFEKCSANIEKERGELKMESGHIYCAVHHLSQLLITQLLIYFIHRHKCKLEENLEMNLYTYFLDVFLHNTKERFSCQFEI